MKGGQNRLKAYKSTTLIDASGEMNIPKELSTTMKVPGALTNRQGLIMYPMRHIIKLPRLTSIYRGASDARSIPAATEFCTKFTCRLLTETHKQIM